MAKCAICRNGEAEAVATRDADGKAAPVCRHCAFDFGPRGSRGSGFTVTVNDPARHAVCPKCTRIIGHRATASHHCH